MGAPAFPYLLQHHLKHGMRWRVCWCSESGAEISGIHPCVCSPSPPRCIRRRRGGLPFPQLAFKRVALRSGDSPSLEMKVTQGPNIPTFQKLPFSFFSSPFFLFLLSSSSPSLFSFLEISYYRTLCLSVQSAGITQVCHQPWPSLPSADVIGSVVWSWVCSNQT